MNERQEEEHLITRDRTINRFYIREIARNIVTFFALLVMILVIVDKNANETNLQEQLDTFKGERTAADLLAAQKLDCTRRYQDAKDQQTTEQGILIGEFLVIITQIPPGADRATAVQSKIDQLDATNIAARAAVAAQIEYNNKGNPLPCPLEPTVPMPPTTDSP